MADTPRGRNKKITGTSGNIDRRGDGLGTGPVGNQQGYAGRPGTSSGGSSQGQQGGHSGYQGHGGNLPGGPHRPNGPGPDRPSRAANSYIPVTSSPSARRGRKLSPVLIVILIVLAFLLIRSCTSASDVDYGGSAGTYSSSQSSTGPLETLPTEKPSGYGAGSSSGQASSSSGAAPSSAGSAYGTGYGSYSGFGSSNGYGNGYSYSSLFGNSGGYSNSSVSNGWSLSSNTGKLDGSVVSGARKKLTSIKGGGKDVVTVMIYMCGTDLESRSGMATSDLKEMASAEIGENVNILVYTGGCRRWQTSGISSTVNHFSIRRIRKTRNNEPIKRHIDGKIRIKGDYYEQSDQREHRRIQRG